MGCWSNFWAKHDPDEVFSYSTFKIVVIRDRYLGFLHYLFYLVIFGYIAFKVVQEESYYKMADPVGSVRMNLRAPTDPPLCMTGLTNTSPTCDKYNYFKPTSELSYCAGRTCAYMNESEITYPVDSGASLSITTRMTISNESRDCSPIGNSTCAFRVVGDTATLYTADIEDYSLRIVHRVVAPAIGLDNTDYTLTGYWQQASCASNTCEPSNCNRWETATNDTYIYLDGQTTIADISYIMKMAKFDLDAPSLLKNTTSYRSQGVILLIEIRYYGDDEAVEFHLRPLVLCNTDYKIVQSVPEISDVFAASAEKTSFDRHGIRVVVIQTGQLHGLSVMNLLVNLTVSVGLLKMAQVLVDLMALYFMPEKRLYRRSKYQYTEDFSDLRERLRHGSEADIDHVIRDNYGSFGDRKKRAEGDEAASNSGEESVPINVLPDSSRYQ